jgi:hypothetical protein
MTVTFEVASGSVLPSPDAPRKFTATGELSFAIVRFRPDVDRPVQRAEETVWRDGSFRYPYSLESTKVGNLYTVVRQGGWTSDLELYVQEKFVALSATLQTNIGSSALAMWELGIAANGDEKNFDRSGNSRDLTFQSVWSAPDLIPGDTAILTWAADGVVAGPSGVLANTIAALNVLGEMSVTMRLYPVSYQLFSSSNNQYIYTHGNFGDTSDGGNVTCSLVYGTGHTLVYFAQTGAGKSAIIYDSGLSVPKRQWSFVSLRRSTTGVVTVGVNGAYATSGALALPTNGSTGYVNLGRAPLPTGGSSPNFGWLGLMKDVVVWNRRLTDAEELAKRKEAMGLP